MRKKDIEGKKCEREYILSGAAGPESFGGEQCSRLLLDCQTLSQSQI